MLVRRIRFFLGVVWMMCANLAVLTASEAYRFHTDYMMKELKSK